MMNCDNATSYSGCYTIPDNYSDSPSTIINITTNLTIETPSNVDILTVVYNYCNANGINAVLKHSENTGCFLWKKTRYYFDVTGERSSIQKLGEYLKECIKQLNQNK